MAIATNKGGTFKDVVITPLVGTAVTVGSLTNFSVIRDTELIEEQYADSRFKAIYGGPEVIGISITCKDLDVWKNFPKGKFITTVTGKIEGVVLGDGTSEDQDDTTATLTNGYVSEAVALELGPDGTPAEISITIMGCRHPDTGADSTLVVE